MMAADAMKIMITLCSPTTVRYDSAEVNEGSGCSSSARMNMAPRPPAKRKNRMMIRYWTPITLWSMFIRK